MLLTHVAALTIAVLAPQGSVSGISCPIMGGKANLSTGTFDYNGVRYGFCCGGCISKFAADPHAAIANPKMKGKTLGISLFDPLSRRRIEMATAKAFSNYAGVRFYFATVDEKRKFDKDPRGFGSLPTKEALYCPVKDRSLRDYASTVGYGDFGGVRYYFCCDECRRLFAADSAAYATLAAKHVQAVGGASGK